MTAELKEESPTDLAETMVYLKRAESSFELAAPELGMINPFQIREARMMTKRLEEISTSGTERHLLLETYQGTLLLMGRVLTRTALTEASRLEVVRTWNESMNMVEEVPGSSRPRRDEDLSPSASMDDDALYVHELIQEYEELCEKRSESRSPVIRPVEEVLSKDRPPVERAFEASEVLAYPEEWARKPGPEAFRDVDEKPTTPIELPDSLESLSSGDDLPMTEGCGDFAFAGEHRRPLLRSASRFVSGLAEDLGRLAPVRRPERFQALFGPGRPLPDRRPDPLLLIGQRQKSVPDPVDRPFCRSNRPPNDEETKARNDPGTAGGVFRPRPQA
jgi:hypothetical protein